MGKGNHNKVCFSESSLRKLARLFLIWRFPDYRESEDFASQYLDFLLHKYSYDTDSWYQRSQRD